MEMENYMKKLYLKISVIFIILFFMFANCSYGVNEIGELKYGQQQESSKVIYLSDDITIIEGKKISSTSSTSPQSIDDIVSSADDFISSGENNVDGTISQGASQQTIDLIYNVLLAIGLVIAVICGVILGVQFMMSSSEGQAQVKEKLIPYVVGCVIIFGAFGIWKLVMVLLQGF